MKALAIALAALALMGSAAEAASDDVPVLSALPRIVKPPHVAYPPDMRAAHIEGHVVLLVRIDTAGKVAEVMVRQTSGYVSLDNAAVAAVRKAQFEPRESAIWVAMPINFVLR